MSGSITTSTTGSISQIVLPPGSVTQTAVANGAIGRSQLAEVSLAQYSLHPETWTVHDSSAALPTSAAADDLGLASGGFGTASPSLQTIDFKAATTTAYALRVVEMPPQYASGTVQVRVRAGMLTTIADDNCTVDLEAHKLNGDGAVAADLVTTAAGDVNSLSKSTHDCTITSSGLVAGSLLDLRLKVVGTDASTGTTVQATITNVLLLLDIRG